MTEDDTKARIVKESMHESKDHGHRRLLVAICITVSLCLVSSVAAMFVAYTSTKNQAERATNLVHQIQTACKNSDNTPNYPGDVCGVVSNVLTGYCETHNNCAGPQGQPGVVAIDDHTCDHQGVLADISATYHPITQTIEVTCLYASSSNSQGG